MKYDLIEALIHRRDLHSLRDLNETHLDLLENILDKGCKALAKKYKIPVLLII